MNVHDPLDRRRRKRRDNAMLNAELDGLQRDLVALAASDPVVLTASSHSACRDGLVLPRTTAQRLWRRLGQVVTTLESPLG
jgi:hypothetical protein